MQTPAFAMSQRIARPLLAFLGAALAGGVAHAQAPGQTPPGSGALAGSPYHAVPDVPEVLPSPRPSLPPPSLRTGSESTSGTAVSFHRGGFSTHINTDGSISFEDHTIGGGGVGVLAMFGLGAWFTFDATDMLMRSIGQDPYLAAKLEIMDSTREERMAMRVRHDAVVMRNALDDLPAYLAAVWGNRQWSPETRRQLLFALWDECAEDGNDFLRAGGWEARGIIERFIASRLPPGSRDGYADVEIVAFNRGRTSRESFTPYTRNRPPMPGDDQPEPPAGDGLDEDVDVASPLSTRTLVAVALHGL